MGADIMCKAAPLILASNRDSAIIAGGEEPKTRCAIAERKGRAFKGCSFSVPGLYAACDILLALPMRNMPVWHVNQEAMRLVRCLQPVGGIPGQWLTGKQILLQTGEDLHKSSGTSSRYRFTFGRHHVTHCMGAARARAEDIFDNVRPRLAIEIYKEQLQVLCLAKFLKQSDS